MIKHAAALLLALAGCAADAATPIYRCGREYTQTPCPDGKLLEASDPRTAAQRAEAKRVAAKERQLAADMERDRRAQAAVNPPSQAAGFSAKPAPSAPAASAPKPKKKRAKTKPPEGVDFKAVEPAKPKAERR
jgi:hypothetical protein